VIKDLGRSRALALLPPAVFLTVLYMSRQAVGPDYYGLARVAQAASASAIVVPICAGLAAWEGWRLRSAKVEMLAPARSEAAMAVRALAPIGVLALAAFAGALVLMLSSGPSVQVSDSKVLLVPAAVVLGHVALAYAAGRALPAVFAVPLAVVGSWLWLVYPISLEPVWLRHLTGYLSTCCDTSTVLAQGAFLAPIGIALACCAAAPILLSRLPRAARIGCASGIVAVAIAGGVALVDHLGSEPTAARPPADLVCRGSDPRVCVWPEHDAVAPLLAQRAHRIRARLRAAGIATPDVVKEASPAGWHVGVVPGAVSQAIDSTLVEGLLPPLPACANGPAPYPGGRVYWPLALWLADAGGVSAKPFRYSVNSADRREAAAASRVSRPVRLAWYRANVRALARCGATPRLLTAG